MTLDISNDSSSDDAINALHRLMKDFSPDEDTEDPYAGNQIEPPKEIVVHAHMIHIVFIVILKYRHWGRGEKVAWTIPVLYKDLRILIAHKKSGLTFRAIDNGARKTAVVREIFNLLDKASQLADRIIEPVIKGQIANGNITLANRHSSLYWRYQFLREKAIEAFISEPPPPKVLQRDDDGRPIATEREVFRPEREGFTYGLAMLDSWFSYFEHIMVLMLPFFNYDPSRGNLTEIIGSNWSKKYQRIFCPDRNSDMMRLFDELKSIKERFRNTFAHGAFEKRGASLFVHFPSLGAIPARLSRHHESVHYSILPMDRAVFDDVCALMDKVEERIHQPPYERPLRIIEAGLDIYFHEDGCSTYNKAIESEESLEEFVEFESWQQTNAMNMDW